MTPTDEERRRVAEALRRYVKTYACPTWRVLCGIVLGGDKLNTVRMIQTLDRLADLIEPAPTGSDRGPTSDPTERGIDSIYEWCRGRLEGADGAEDELYCAIMRAIASRRDSTSSSV